MAENRHKFQKVAKVVHSPIIFIDIEKISLFSNFNDLRDFHSLIETSCLCTEHIYFRGTIFVGDASLLVLTRLLVSADSLKLLTSLV